MAPRGWRDREMKKKSERARARERAKEKEKKGEEGEKVIGGEEVRVEKRRTGIWYRRHCFRSPPFSLPFSPRSPPRAKIPSTSSWRAAPAENYPLTTGCLPFRLLFHLSSVSLPARSSTHRLQYYHLPLSQALPPTPSSVPHLSLFFAANDATPPRRYASSDIYVHF